MDLHYGFHDSCVKELKYISGAYGDEDWMHVINNLRILKVVFHGRFKNSDVIEMEFIGLKYIKMYPTDEKYTCEIFDATMILKEDCIFWCDEGGMSEDDLGSYEGTLICASKVRWRAIYDCIGQSEFYLSRT